MLHDDPRLDVRLQSDDAAGIMRRPLRVIVDSGARTPPASRVFATPGPVLVATDGTQPAREAGLVAAGATVLHLPREDAGLDLRALFGHLAAAQCNEVLVEAGAVLAGAVLRSGLADEVVLYVAPMLLGSTARPLFELPLARMDEKLMLRISDISAVGEDWRITAAPDVGASG